MAEIKGHVVVNENTDMVNIPCSVLVADNEDNFPGLRIPCEINVIRDVANACTSTAKGIRVTITVDGEDVSNALIGSIKIHHNLDYISTFSFELSNPSYSPKINSHFDENKVVVMTAYLNGQEIKMFTGLIDELQSRSTLKEGYRLRIMGSDYGKKLKKTETIISVNEKSAQHLAGYSYIAFLDQVTNVRYRTYRSDIIKYLAQQAGVTDVKFIKDYSYQLIFDNPEQGVNVDYSVNYAGDAVTIDHSFQDQEILDMIRKENTIQGWFIRFDENGTMWLQPKELKSNADWVYGEGEFTELGLTEIYDNIVNKVIILGATFEEVEITKDQTVVEASEPEYNYTDHSYSKSFSEGEVVTGWSSEDANFRIKATYVTFSKPSGEIFPVAQIYRFSITRLNNELTVTDVDYTVSGNAKIKTSNITNGEIYRNTVNYFYEGAFSISITIKTKEQTGGGVEELENTSPEETFTENVTYTTVKATVADTDSITKYGERKPSNEGTLNYPLAETEAQCQRIGENYIKDSHRFVEQPDFEVPFNPKITIGQTVQMSDKKIGYNDDKYLVEEIVHYINIPKNGKISANTRIGGVYYA